MKTGLALWLGLLCAAPVAPAAPAVTCAAQERWQVTLNSGTILWDLHLVKLSGDTLVVRHADSVYAFPLMELDEMRLVHKSERRQNAEPGRYDGVLAGVDDEVHRLTLYDLAERRQIVQQIFQEHPPNGSP